MKILDGNDAKIEEFWHGSARGQVSNSSIFNILKMKILECNYAKNEEFWHSPARGQG